MPECNLCGKKVDEATKIDFEGAIIDVCDECEHFGKVVAVPQSRRPEKPSQFSRPATLDTVVAGTEAKFSGDFGTRIMRAREAMGLSRKDFANKIAEKESLIIRVEGQNMEPDEALTKKMEKFLHIKLRGEATEEEE